jgi:hypothetical protein
MSTQYNINKYVFGIDGFGLPFCDTILSATLAANTDTTVTVPGSSSVVEPTAGVPKFIAIFKYTAAEDVFVALNQTAAVPAGDTFAATTSEQNPNGKYVKAGDVIHFFTAASDVNVTVSLYSLTGIFQG